MLTIRRRRFAPVIIVLLAVSLVLIFIRPAYATEPNCNVWGNTKIFTHNGITATHKAGIEVLPLDSQKLVTGWTYR